MRFAIIVSIIYILGVQLSLGQTDQFSESVISVNEIKSLLERLQVAEKEIQELKQQCKHSSNVTKRYVSDGSAAVGFTTCLSANGDVQHAGNEIIKFDQVLTNVGSGYNSKTGIFIAPRRGLYVIHLAAMARSGVSKLIDIVKDGNRVDTAYVGAHGVTDYQSVAKEWVLELNQGSQVWMKSGSYHGDVIDGWCKTAFAGFLVSEM